MKKLLFAVALLVVPASAVAADLPPNPKYAVKAPVVDTTASGFYVGAIGGIGLSKTQNELTIPGIATGTISAYPTGFQAGGVVGYASTMGALYYGASFEGLYDFSQGSLPQVATLPGVIGVASRKNGFLFQEGAEVGISLATLGGYIPASGQPSNWPVPVTLPASVYSNLIFALRGGVAERAITLCGAVDLDGNTACDTKVAFAPYVGAKAKAMLSTNVEAFVTGDVILWRQADSFTPTTAAGFAPPFTNTVSATNEFVTRVGIAYHFNSLGF